MGDIIDQIIRSAKRFSSFTKFKNEIAALFPTDQLHPILAQKAQPHCVRTFRLDIVASCSTWLNLRCGRLVVAAFFLSQISISTFPQLNWAWGKGKGQKFFETECFKSFRQYKSPEKFSGRNLYLKDQSHSSFNETHIVILVGSHPLPIEVN